MKGVELALRTGFFFQQLSGLLERTIFWRSSSSLAFLSSIVISADFTASVAGGVFSASDMVK